MRYVSSRGGMVLALLTACGACSGAIEGDGPADPGGGRLVPNPSTLGSGANAPGAGAPAPGSTTPPDPAVTPPARTATASCKGVDPGPRVIRRLTRFEYGNTVRDLLGPEFAGAAQDFPAEERRHGFDNNAAALTVSPPLSEQYLLAADRLASRYLDKQLAAISAGCSGEAACARRFFEDLGKRAFRRPLAAEDLTALEKVYEEGRRHATAAGKPTEAFRNGLRLALATVLQAPRFLYRVEVGLPPRPGETAVRLDPYETASRLSYLLWGSMPDAALFAVADAGRLGTREEIAAQVTRMLADARARAMVGRFHELWLELEQIDTAEKDAKLFPAFTKALALDMGRETDRFLDAAFWGDVAGAPGGDLAALLTAPYTFANGALRTFYGLPAGGTSFTRAELDGQRRAGLLTQGSLLAVHSSPNQTSPVKRGLFVREHLLCQELPPPPNAMIELPPLDPKLTTRERFSRHALEAAGHPGRRGHHLGGPRAGRRPHARDGRHAERHRALARHDHGRLRHALRAGRRDHRRPGAGGQAQAADEVPVAGAGRDGRQAGHRLGLHQLQGRGAAAAARQQPALGVRSRVHDARRPRCGQQRGAAAARRAEVRAGRGDGLVPAPGAAPGPRGPGEAGPAPDRGQRAGEAPGRGGHRGACRARLRQAAARPWTAPSRFAARHIRGADTCHTRTSVRPLLALVALLPACAGGGGVDVAAPDAGELDGGLPDAARPDHAGPMRMDLRIEGGFARKAQPLGGGRVLVLVEPPLHLRVGFGRPRRELRWVRSDGAVERVYAAGEGRSLLDFARHPSGALTLLLAGDDGYHLVRIARDGGCAGDTRFDDPLAAADPPSVRPGDPGGPIDAYHHDGGRVVAVGEEAALALRTGRHSVVYHRVAFQGGAPVRRQRVLAIPAVRIWPIGLTGGTYDTFGQLESRYGVHLAVDEGGVAYVAVRAPDLAELRLRRVFGDVFGEALEGDPDAADGYVVRIAPDGRRLGTSVAGTSEQDELYGLAAANDAAWAVGRTERWNEQGPGHDALVARIDGSTGAVDVRALDLDRGDIAFDAAATGAGVLIVGASGYAQNPRGASVSEDSAASARWLGADGRLVPVALPPGPRHNEARLVIPLGARRFLVGGMLDGPGTHSADGDPALLRARGFLTDVVVH